MSYQSGPWKRCFRHSSHRFREKLDFSTVSSCCECSKLNQAVNHNRGFSISFRYERPSTTTKKIWNLGRSNRNWRKMQGGRRKSEKWRVRSPESWLSKAWMKELKEGKLDRQTAAIAIDEVHSVTEWYVSLFAYLSFLNFLFIYLSTRVTFFLRGPRDAFEFHFACGVESSFSRLGRNQEFQNNS